MRIGSLFSGIGGLEMGLEAAIPGAHTVWQVEQADYPRAVLAQHWPNARRYRYVQSVAADAHTLEPVNLICGGFPCTDISVAGSGAGIDGGASGLWWSMLYIVDVVRPRFVVVENVGALRRRGLRAVLGGLAACGYNAEWSMLSAAQVGAPHRRERLFIIADLPNAGGGQLRIEQSGQRGTPATRREGAPIPRVDGPANMGRPIEPGLGGASHGLRRWARGTGVEPWEEVPRTADRGPYRAERLRALGNAVVPQCAYEVGLRILENWESR